MSVFLIVGGIVAFIAVVVVLAVLVEPFTTWPEEEALERDERTISQGPSDWGRFRW